MFLSLLEVIIQNRMELFVLLHNYHFSSRSRVANIGSFTRIAFGFSVSLLTPVSRNSLSITMFYSS